MSWLTEYKSSLKMVEVEEFFDLYFYRPLAFLFVKAIYSTSLTPNQITLLSMLLGIAGAACIATGSASMLAIGALLLVGYDVLDCSDGQLARLKKNGTRIGRILDGFADYIVVVGTYFAIAIGFASQAENPLLWWALTAAAGFSNMVHSVLVDYYRNRFLDVVLGRVSTFEEDLAEFEREYTSYREQGVRLFDRFIIRVYLGYSGMQRGLASGNKKLSFLSKVDPGEYYRRNKMIMKLWLMLGPTSQLTYVIVGALFNRLDVYLYALIVAGNLLALILHIAQTRINRSLQTTPTA